MFTGKHCYGKQRLNLCYNLNIANFNLGNSKPTAKTLTLK